MQERNGGVSAEPVFRWGQAGGEQCVEPFLSAQSLTDAADSLTLSAGNLQSNSSRGGAFRCRSDKSHQHGQKRTLTSLKV